MSTIANGVKPLAVDGDRARAGSPGPRRSTASAASSARGRPERARRRAPRARRPEKRAQEHRWYEHRIRGGGSVEGTTEPSEEDAVPTYIMLSTLTPEGIQTVKNNPQPHPRGQQRGRAARRRGQGAVGDARLVRLRQRDRGARRQDDGADLARARLARHRPLRDADRDPDRRFHRRALSQGPGDRRRRAASTRSCARCCARRSSLRCSAPRATPGIARRRRRRAARRSRRTSTSSSSARRRRSSPGFVGRAAPCPCFGPSAGGGASSRAPRPTPRRS